MGDDDVAEYMFPGWTDSTDATYFRQISDFRQINGDYDDVSQWGGHV